MYRFLLAPKWLFGHALLAAVLVLFPVLGFWQLSRYQEANERNARIEERLAAPSRPLASIGVEGDSTTRPEDLEFRRVSATGRYRPGEEVLLTGRTLDSRPGHHVLTPLELEDGAVLLVNRGWIPFALDTPPVEEARPPVGQVEIEGTLLLSDQGPRRLRTGASPVLRVTTVELAALDSQVRGDLLPVYLQLAPASAGQDAFPVPAQAPTPGETGQHLSYAAQWFLFTLVAAIGYPLLLVRTARDRGGDPVSAREHVPG